jgi:hypothetical protein
VQRAIGKHRANSDKHVVTILAQPGGKFYRSKPLPSDRRARVRVGSWPNIGAFRSSHRGLFWPPARENRASYLGRIVRPVRSAVLRIPRPETPLVDIDAAQRVFEDCR